MSSRSAAAGSETEMQSLTGEGRSAGPAAAEEGAGGSCRRPPVRATPGVEHVAMGAGLKRPRKTDEIADVFPGIDPHHERHDRTLRRNEGVAETE